MKSIFSTAFAAPVGYYKAFVQSETAVMEMHEHFIKQTIRNRCAIATSNGPLILTIPLSHRKNNMPVQEVQICYKSDWQRQHLKSLATAYHSSPFFEFYIDELKHIYAQQPSSLIEWNNTMHQQILKWLKVAKSFEKSSIYIKVYENANDFRNGNWEQEMIKPYHQVFENKHGFMAQLSVMDLLFNCGNQSLKQLTL